MNEKLNMSPIIIYNDVIKDKELIYKENKHKCGIYKWTNKINNKIYIGSSINLSNRFRHYLSLTNITRIIQKEKSYIYSAMVKHEYSCFTLEILEYCNINTMTHKEQYYIDNLVPEYNILKVANTHIGYTPGLEARKAMSIAQRKTINDI